MKLATHLLTLMAAKKSINGNWKEWRHLGVAFHIGVGGTIATCKHIIDSVKEKETLVACEMTNSRFVLPVYDIRCHGKYDFAVAKVDRPSPIQFPVIYQGNTIYVGDDIMAFGYFCNGKQSCGDGLELVARLFKGHVVRIDGLELADRSPSTCEVSFPSISGFSGTPLLHSKDVVLGMLYGNHESSIEVYKYEELNSSSERHSESIHRVIELGLAHTAMDIRKFLLDLDVSGIPDGPNDSFLNNAFPF